MITDPKPIPLDDLTGNKESEKDYTIIPWPEPKPQLPTVSTIGSTPFMPIFRPQPVNTIPMNVQPPMTQLPPQIMTSIQPMPQEIPQPVSGGVGGGGGGGGGGWRTGDGKLVVPDTYPQTMDTQPMVGPQGMMGGPPMYNQDGYMMGNPDDMNYNYQGHPPPPPYPNGPPPHFQGGPPPRGPPPMHGNRGRGWGFRGGPPPRGMPWRGGWRGGGGGKPPPPICRQFTKNGFCRVGDKCQYLHPGVNCPPY